MTHDDEAVCLESSAFDAEAKARHHLPEEINLAKRLGFRIMGYFHEACTRDSAAELCGTTHDDAAVSLESLALDAEAHLRARQLTQALEDIFQDLELRA